MSEIKYVGYIWMALNISKCHHLMPLHFKGLMHSCQWYWAYCKMTV